VLTSHPALAQATGSGGYLRLAGCVAIELALEAARSLLPVEARFSARFALTGATFGEPSLLGAAPDVAARLTVECRMGAMRVAPTGTATGATPPSFFSCQLESAVESGHAASDSSSARWCSGTSRSWKAVLPSSTPHAAEAQSQVASLATVWPPTAAGAGGDDGYVTQPAVFGCAADAAKAGSGAARWIAAGGILVWGAMPSSGVAIYLSASTPQMNRSSASATSATGHCVIVGMRFKISSWPAAPAAAAHSSTPDLLYRIASNAHRWVRPSAVNGRGAAAGSAPRPLPTDRHQHQLIAWGASGTKLAEERIGRFQGPEAAAMKLLAALQRAVTRHDVHRVRPKAVEL
jgi:hypothetical protein